ncbi:hypothetical protein IMCC3135_18350 [Granulosicoccus antarcticus IMCC3135]|uniref:DUF2383 domain-containing protein n=2 Tax=Granulosicoccus TaxID=437504 RepID=A0A2Z2NR87_9GAMM|nr:hypothetical protein IMCC3135_18350 [Granulosicoccus antarcticus IMCC3135]
MLLDEMQIALNELLVTYQEAADHFEDAVNYVQRNDTKQLFETVREGHNQAVDVLTEQVRKTGALPRAQDTDREEARQIFTHVKAALSDDEHEVFLNDRMRHEKQIEAAIADALQLPFEAEAKACLEALHKRELLVIAELETALNERATGIR